MSWTDERIDRLKTMWENGLTASQIAEELGGVSRNAVIGKAHRLGLKSRPSPVKAGDADSKAASAKPKAKPVEKPATPRAAPVERTERPERVVVSAPPIQTSIPSAPRVMRTWRI